VSVQPAPNDSLDFVRFCYRRRHVGWPFLYDEMCAVAARGAYHGLGFAELAERGITFCLGDMPKLKELVDQVIAEDLSSTEPVRTQPPMTLSIAPAQP
jgi:hypothetical protein